eukprot:NODE_870_length_2288_cov_107.894688_g743_i0.p1 GENE.NODE_870_length_2288_cov_107.894688_g743_i0~~NODE_870_length_2288_cov_107.894688_g743_i0.p1  ORF type:complete len:717 (-),score=152.64 NODE_870_length_2288_cov_107.894688_g743_i0:75-2225(-)
MSLSPDSIDRELLREFYKSGASNFAVFREAKAKRESSTPTSTTTQKRPKSPPTTGVHAIKDLTATRPKAADRAPPADVSPNPAQITTAPPAPAPTQVATKPAKVNKVQSSQTNDLNPGIEAASPEYILFLKQQQDLQGCHKKLEEILIQLENDRRTHQAEIGKTRGQVSDLLSSLESGTNWNLSSKYNVQQLIKDAGLKLQPQELYRPDMQPKYFDIIQQEENLRKLRTDHSNKEIYNVYKTAIDNGERRLDRVEKEIKKSQLDATDMSRLPDTLFISLDHILATPTIQMQLLDSEEKLEHLLFKLDETKESRAQALHDGEMQLAEKKYYNVVELYESILEIVLDKLATIEKTKKEMQQFDKVGREQYQKRAAEDTAKLKDDKDKLKQRCEADLKRIFALKERVDAVEKQTVEKLAEELKQSDTLLKENARQQDVVWVRMEELEKELERLERERHEEFKKRIHNKDKDEHRRMEYDKFCQVVDGHSQLLDLTIRNCDTAIHCITLTSEFVNMGFNNLGSHLQKYDKDLDDLLLETHKQHLEMFRGLYLSLGELAHKKDKRIEEIDNAIKTSHIQQELAAETLNPNAKKYSDAKKELLRIRDEVEEDLNELKEKAQVALTNFTISEKALHDAGVDFLHPTVEQQEQELETKAKMVEYKAIATGHVDALPIKAELQTIKASLMETKKLVEGANKSTSLRSTLPLLRSGTPSVQYSMSP